MGYLLFIYIVKHSGSDSHQEHIWVRLTTCPNPRAHPHISITLPLPAIAPKICSSRDKQRTVVPFWWHKDTPGQGCSYSEASWRHVGRAPIWYRYRVLTQIAGSGSTGQLCVADLFNSILCCCIFASRCTCSVMCQYISLEGEFRGAEGAEHKESAGWRNLLQLAAIWLHTWSVQIINWTPVQRFALTARALVLPSMNPSSARVFGLYMFPPRACVAFLHEVLWLSSWVFSIMT